MSNRFLAKHELKWNDVNRVERGTFEVATNGKVACILWKDKGLVRLTATCHSTCRVQVRRCQRGMQPFSVLALYVVDVYNKYFHGVDGNDQLRGDNYGICLTFRAQKYTVKFFMGIIDVVLSNAWILWRTVHPSQQKLHAKWINKLAELMLKYNPKNDPEYKRARGGSTKAGQAQEVKMQLHRSRQLQIRNGKRQRSVCPMCVSQGVKPTSSTVTYGCQECQVGLCPGQCHQQWHTMTATAQGKLKQRRHSLDFVHDDVQSK